MSPSATTSATSQNKPPAVASADNAREQRDTDSKLSRPSTDHTDSNYDRQPQIQSQPVRDLPKTDSSTSKPVTSSGSSRQTY